VYVWKGWAVDMDNVNVLYTISSQVTFKYNRWVLLNICIQYPLSPVYFTMTTHTTEWISEAMHGHGVEYIPTRLCEGQEHRGIKLTPWDNIRSWDITPLNPGSGPATTSYFEIAETVYIIKGEGDTLVSHLLLSLPPPTTTTITT